MKITSQPLTFLDTTDSRKLEVYISSNHPTIQLYDVNDKSYTPDWSKTNLKLSADVFLDSTETKPEKIQWYRQYINDTTETMVSSGNYTEEITINSNMSQAVVTYICRVEYQGIKAFSKIVFTKTDTGLNGTDGTPAPAVQAQYSTDGATNWTVTLNAATHKYIRYSYDGGKTWTTAIKMVGEDGTSVKIKGTATSKTAVSGTSYYTLVYNSATITGAAIGDAYLLDGNMYVCIDSRDGNDYFMDVGRIQGPQGNDGQSSYVFIRYATDANGANMVANPTSTTTHIGICTVNTNVAPTTANSYTWSKFVGDSAKSIILSGTSQIFKVSSDATPIYTPTTIKVTAQVVNTTVATWEYSVNGGIDWTTTIPAGASLDTSTNTLTITGKDLTSNSLVIKASNGVYKDVYTVSKVFDGATGATASMAFLTNENISFSANASGQVALMSFTTNVVAYNGTTKTTPIIGAISGLPSGMTVIPNKGTAYSSATPTTNNLIAADLYTTSALTTKVDKTKLVNGDSFVVGNYLYTYNSTDQNFKCQFTTVQGSERPSVFVVNNEIMLTFSIANNTTLGSELSTNDTITIPVTSPVSTDLKLSWSKINTGATGVGIESTTVSYGVSDSLSTQPTEWQSTIPVVAEGKYLWTRTIIDYTDEKIPDTVTYIYAKQGTKGDSGTAGSSVTVSSVQYQEGVSATTAPTGTWSNAVVAVAEGKYLWTKTAFSDGKTAYGVAKQGANGKDGVGISSITIDYGVSDNASTKPTNWQQSIPVVAEGKYLWTRTITDYTDASVADTVAYVYAKQGIKGETGVAGSSVTVSSIQYQAGTSATTAPTGTWSDSVVSVSEGNYLWTKTTFSDGKIAYGVAKQGQKGDKGDQGIQGIQGPKGEQGIQGPKGVDGQTSYFHIKYSANANGNPMSETPSTYIGTYVDYTANDSDDYTKYTWSRFVGSQGAKGDQGIAGTNGTDGKTSYLHIAYATSADGKSGFSVGDSVSKTYIGQYTDYTEADSTDPTKYKWTLIKGDKGDQGVQGPKGNDGQQLYTWIKYADSPTSGMSNDPAGKTYIGLAYNKTTATESSTYSDYMWSLIKGETGAVGPKGNDGQQYYTWIKYADNASGANMSDSPTGKLYIGLAYNKTTSAESNTASDYTWALFKGDKGDKGTDAYTVLLTNESHVFAGSISAAIASSATTQVLAYNGATSQSVTIVSVNGVAASTASTATGIAGLSFQCNALSGTSPTITFTCTTSFVSPNGTIPIVIKVGSISITKMFTYSIAFKGATGGTGAASSSYWLVSNADTVQKTSNGDILCTPATLTFTGKSQTGSSAPADYAGRWIIAYSTDGIAYTNAYTSTANEASASLTASPSYKAVRARMYLAGGTTTLLDEQIIPFVSDGAVGASGVDAVTFQIYSSNGYALSTSTPTVTLQTFAYIGDVAITAGATYQWYTYSNTGWTAVTGATNQYLVVSRDDVVFSKSYMCKMTFNGVEYTSVATIDDKNDENRVFAKKPSNYSVGDLWIVGVDYAPTGIEVGTLLRAEHTNTSYADNDWVTATKYDDKINSLQESLSTYDQYFSLSVTDGLKISARDANGTESKFSTSLTNERLSFNYGNESVAYINGTKMNIKEAEIESPLTVTGKYSGSTMLQAPVINIGNFSIIVESNGSLSIVANT